MVGLMVTSHCVTQICCTQSPCPCGRPLLMCTSTGDTQTLKGVSGSVSVGSLSPGAHKILFEPSEHLLWVWGLILNRFCPSYHLAGASPLPLDVEYIFLVASNIILSMVAQQQVVILESSQGKISPCPSTLLNNRERTQPGQSRENWIKDLLSMALPFRTRSSFSTVSFSHQEASLSLLSLSFRGQAEWKPQSQKTNQTDHIGGQRGLLNETMSHAMWGYPRPRDHGGEVWQNVHPGRREWQTTSVFLPREPHEQYEKAKR